MKKNKTKELYIVPEMRGYDVKLQHVIAVSTDSNQLPNWEDGGDIDQI